MATSKTTKATTKNAAGKKATPKVAKTSTKAVPALPTGIDGEHRLILASQLVKSKNKNVRRKSYTPRSLDGLLALILAAGRVLQNLIVYEQRDDKGNPTGMYEVCAGGRRIDAVHLGQETGKLPENFKVPCLIADEDRAIEMSLMENSEREAMHPADVYEAMQAMIDQENATPDQLAKAFHTDRKTVRRILKLAAVAPMLVELFRDDKIGIEEMMALALLDDQESQVALWNSLPQHERRAYHIRQRITADQVDLATDRLGLFVGAKTYESAGGTINVDLFAETKNSGFATDPILLERLAMEKLDAEAEAIRATGQWSFVETRLRLQHNDRWLDFAEVGVIRREERAEEKAEREGLEKRQQELEEKLGNLDETSPEYDALQEEFEKVCSRLDELDEGQYEADPEEAKLAGVLIGINNKGELVRFENLIRKSDKVAQKTVDADGSPLATKVRPVHSERLVRQLSAQRTAAIQAVLATRPDVAMAALAAQLADQVFNHGLSSSVIKIHATTPALSQYGDAVKDCRGVAVMNELAAEWAQRLEGVGDIFQWLLTQPKETTFALLGFCISCTVNTIQHLENSGDNGYAPLASALGIDFADWWQPTAADYLSHVPKGRIVEVVTQARSAEDAAPLAKMKRAELVAEAARKMEGTRWLPDMLRVGSAITVENELAKAA